MNVAPRFGIGLKVEGSLRPDQPIHLTMQAKANFSTQDAEVRLVLPEVAAGRKRGWERLHLSAEPVPDVVLRRSFNAGEGQQERRTIVIPEPGYYQVIASVVQHSDDRATDGGRMVGDVSSEVLWLWIDERGGRVTTRFDPGLFDEGTWVLRGPRGSVKKPPRVVEDTLYPECSLNPSEPAILSACGGIVDPSPTPPPPVVPTATSVRVTYRDGGTGAAIPLVGARVVWDVTAGTSSTVLRNGGAFTDATGTVPPIDCSGTDNQVELTVYTLNGAVDLKNYTTAFADRNVGVRVRGACGSNIPLEIDAYTGQLFTNLNKTYEGHGRVFGITPPVRINAGFYALTPYGIRYDYSGSELHFEPRAQEIYGAWGAVVAAHEYGHLYQDKYLFQAPAQNGLMRMYSNSCPTPEHYPQFPTSFGCAWGEAFADWYAALVRDADVPAWKQQLDANSYYLTCVDGVQNGQRVYCSDDGSKVQGAVAAFLFDMTDGIGGETFDQVQIPPALVLEAIKRCSVRPANSGSYVPYTGIDHLIWCFENRAPYQFTINAPSGPQTVTFFNDRRQSDWAVAASGNVLASYSDVFRKLWLADLYSRRPGVGTNPSFRSDEQPIDPDSPLVDACTPGVPC